MRNDLEPGRGSWGRRRPPGLPARATAWVVAATLGVFSGAAAIDAPTVMVGAARVEVTPREPVVLAGYGSRTAPFEGIDSPLWARAMVIGEREPAAVVVLDNCGVPAAVTARLAGRLAGKGIDPGRLVVAVTHTHNAPNLEGYAPVLWAGRTTPEEDRRMAAYTAFAVERMEAAVVAALEARRPMHLGWARGRVGFGGNRRVLRDGKWAGFGFQRSGPVDHSLPVLAARDAGGEVRVVWANYACHCTTVGARNHVGGDWAGYANAAMEEAFPGAVALMSIGCGADVGPQPSGNLEIAGKHGRAVADEVARMLGPGGGTVPLATAPTVASTRVALPLEAPKPRAHWEAQRAAGGFDGQLAAGLLARLDAGESLPTAVDYPISAWTFGDDLAMVFLAGEVVVDYAVRLNRELDWSRLWVTAWANDMPGYIPSARVLSEGGYEADFSQVYYGQPGRYSPGVEEVVVSAVRGLLGPRFKAAPDQPLAPFHRLPSARPEAYRRVASWAAGAEDAGEGDLLNTLRRLVRVAVPGVGRFTKNDGEATEWHDFAGDFVRRRFIRQMAVGTELAWTAPRAATPGPAVYCFTGGVGWESEPETGGFGLWVGGRERLRFDVTRRPSRWVSDDGGVELVYLPTWTSGVDSGGFFFIGLDESETAAGDGGPIRFAVRSAGAGSRRWFAVDARQEIPAELKKLAAALGVPGAGE